MTNPPACLDGYVSLYVCTLGKVCISTIHTAPALMYYYTRRELQALIRDSPAWDYRLAIYQEALSKFPKP